MFLFFNITLFFNVFILDDSFRIRVGIPDNAKVMHFGKAMTNPPISFVGQRIKIREGVGYSQDWEI